MDIEKIKQLRSSIPVSLSKAILLLKENEGDILKCEAAYHGQNIRYLYRMAECDEETARQSYLISQGNIEKALARIQQRMVCITSEPNPALVGKIGFIIWAENKSLDPYIHGKSEGIFVPTEDFELVKPLFEAVYPVIWESSGGERVSDGFDICGHNHLSNAICREIVEGMAWVGTKNEDEERFLCDLIKWFNRQLRFAHKIVVYGNL